MGPEAIPFRVRVSSKGQVVIPKVLRDAYGIKEGDEVLMVPVEEGILVRTLPVKSDSLRGLLTDLCVGIGECEAILAEAKSPGGRRYTVKPERADRGEYRKTGARRDRDTDDDKQLHEVLVGRYTPPGLGYLLLSKLSPGSHTHEHRPRYAPPAQELCITEGLEVDVW